MNLLTENLKKVDMFNDILESLKSENKAISFKNIMDIQKAYYVYSLTINNDKSSIIVQTIPTGIIQSEIQPYMRPVIRQKGFFLCKPGK